MIYSEILLRNLKKTVSVFLNLMLLLMVLGVVLTGCLMGSKEPGLEVFWDGNECDCFVTEYQKGLKIQLIYCRQEEFSP